MLTELAAPQNVTLAALNTNYTLTWDWDGSMAPNQDVTFTTDYIDEFKLKYVSKKFDWTTVCDNSSRKSCCLTEVLHHLGMYVLRVRASVNGSHSNWTQKPFWPDKDAALGPPSRVVLYPAGSVLDVHISDPLTSTNSSMREIRSELYYHIVYWKGPAVHNLSCQTNLVTLPDLKAWTVYCVTVQCRSNYFNKRSSFTRPLCMQTEGSTMVWWNILLYFLGSLVICFFIMLLLFCGFYKTYNSIKDKLFPSGQLPKHFQEYLSDSHSSDLPRLLTPESELLCDKVMICPEALSAPPAGLEPDSSGRHSRQGSSGSSDSGMYSSGDSSGLRQPGSTQSSAGPCDSEQVTMQDVAPEPKSAIADEGIMDMCM
uniref:Uncharacterized protein n=1 Tax=Mola mola TaxID=94237 RepID=A0A3Q3XGK5_MOLML